MSARRALHLVKRFFFVEFSKNTVEPLDTAEESSIPTPRKI